MKTLFSKITLLKFLTLLFISCEDEVKAPVRQPVNYTILLDLSDRVLASDQLDKDFNMIETTFKSFESHAKRNLILTSKDRFSVKIIPQKNSKFNAEKYEDLLQIHLDEVNIKDKNNALIALSKSMKNTLTALKKEAVYSSKSTDYFGVDIWAYLHDNGKNLSKSGYKNTVIVMTDGYFDFENQSHVIKNNNQYTSTRFLNELNGNDWQQIAEAKKYGLLPIQLEKSTKWIVAGVSGKKANDILQTEKIAYFWKKWLKQSGVNTSQFILNGSKTEMGSLLVDQLK